MAGAATIWDRLASCVSQLDEPFRAADIVSWFRTHYPGVNEASLRAHIQSATSNVAASSKIAGFSRRTPLITRLSHGVYVRHADDPVGAHDRETSVGSVDHPDLVLIGCSERKTSHAGPAKDLYLGDRFLKARSYAEGQQRPWYVLSGKWGLLSPEDVIGPYDLYLGAQSSGFRRAWGEWVAAQLELAEAPLYGKSVEIHASQLYADALREPLRRMGLVFREPLRGLRQGEQLGWYAPQSSPRSPVRATAPAAPQIVEAISVSEDARVMWGPRDSGPFEYRWPEGSEHFDTTWEIGVECGGKSYTVRHCLGFREVYGRGRRHSVTFVNRVPEVEGVAADDFEESHGLLSPLKGADRRLIRHVVDVPEPYRAFTLVDHRLEIDAPYSRDAVAVKLAEDDVKGWAFYALARQAVRLATMRTSEVGTDPAPVPAEVPTIAPGSGLRADVVRALLVLGETGLGDEWVGASSFTPNPAANQLLVDDPFAFLLGVVFDQGIPAERAWQAPYDLSLRLGHLDPARIAVEQEAVRRAIDTPPKLHRFVEKMPAWIVSAAHIVVRDYGGDAGSIWAGTPTARELQRRLDAFPGIGQKKAAMAVEILERDLAVPVAQMSGSDVAYDVHVRRVFLRTGLAEYDDLDHMVDVARRANPERPGAIDLPAWHVGRTWCRAGIPNCGSCPLTAACPKDIDAASKVRGV